MSGDARKKAELAARIIILAFMLIGAMTFFLMTIYPDGLHLNKKVVRIGISESRSPAEKQQLEDTVWPEASTNSPAAAPETYVDSVEMVRRPTDEDIRTDTVRDNGTDTAYIRIKTPKAFSSVDDRLEVLTDLKSQWKKMNPRKKIICMNVVPTSGVVIVRVG